MLSRRSFLVSAGAGAAVGSVLSSFAFAADGASIPLGIQLWTVKSEAEKDLEGTLRKVYAAGFREIEFAGYYGKNPADLAKLLKGIGFSLVSTHAGAGDIAKNGEKIIADAKALGLKFVVCSSPGVSPEKEKLPWEERMKAVDLTDWKWNADLFNKFGKQVADAGMTFGYHNHSAEFRKLSNGQTGFDWLFANTDPKLVNIELDVGWVTVGGADPIAILNKHKSRVIALHVKDVGKRGADGKDPASVALGEGVIDWKTVIATAKKNGTKAFFYEQEEPFTRPILDSVKISGAYLQKLKV
ncbi:MAG TPA: sugar phosphate isomerase/epimerase [Steroidobacteraceae bacterium]|nr:sugar phosphate isomerase/epimerase [Steroidobacteraceae bacterium]